MTWFIDRERLANNAALQHQNRQVAQMRAMYHRQEQAHGALARDVLCNAFLPQEAYLQIDTVTRRAFLPEGSIAGDGLLVDLLALGRSVNIGDMVSAYRRSGELEGARTSLDGQHAKPVDELTYDFEQDLVPIHDKSVGRKWRELEALRARGFDSLIDDVEAATLVVREQMLDNFLDGSTLNFKGARNYGIRTNPNTQAVTLLVDLSSPATTFAQAQAEIVRILKVFADNNQSGLPNFYFSQDIWFNMLRTGTNDTRFSTFLEGLQRIPGIGQIKMSLKMTGNELLAFIPRQDVIAPIVGQAVNSVPLMRPTPYSDFHVWVWGAAGLRITADQKGRSGVVYASS